ncbi:PREDICTED: uncharacterized protein LOC104792617 [Camelina sativa]|uniref:Uncharacterized protein LOC104792617 n=1 Tax=Camelina sativa TaxID=90675 RepID=A0ABM1RU30_CAMSA|nr:PREDICTED: uncharacterized protein LOC104792617 [Camelina sativa]XP_019102519.1 PREDICTED: uncharacterized protein LOC104792617 [Camelina sativa]
MDSPLHPSTPDLNVPYSPVFVSRLSASSSSDNVVEGDDDDGARSSRSHGVFNWGEFCSFRNLSEPNICWATLALLVWIFASFILVKNLFGPKNVWLGPSSSIIVDPSSFFVKSIMVKELDYSKSGLQLYGFYGSPPLDRLVNWSESRVFPLSHDTYKGWPYYFNEGSSMNISYRVKPEGSAVQLVVNEGSQGISRTFWEEPAFHYINALSWNLIEGSGMIELKMIKSSSYYLAVANLKKRKDVEVELTIDVRAVLYDTKQSFYNCTFSNGECTFKLNAMSLVGNSFVVTSPAPSHEGVSIEDKWYIKFTYQPRGIGYVIFIGVVTCFMVVALLFCNKLQCFCEEGYNDLARAYLIGNKDDDVSSIGSCNEPFANDDADLEDNMRHVGEASNQTRRLCAICLDAPRDCFFLPCGHCVSCYECGTKMAEAGVSCPICQRNMKKVKRIYTV